MHSSGNAETAALYGSLYIGIFILAAISYVITAFLLGRVFKKADIPEWKAWVPVYNYWILLEMGGQPGFWSIVAFIPYIGFVGMIFLAIAAYHIGRKFGKEGWFVLLAIFIPIVWLTWLAFDDSKWQAEHVVAEK